MTTTTDILERPVLFSGPMVCAIGEDLKTQTRRIINPQPEPMADGWYWRHPGVTEAGYCHTSADAMARLMVPCCPYGQVGTRLWVRENLRRDEGMVWRYCADGEQVGPRGPLPEMLQWFARKPGHCPSIHMPRWASRHTLEITGIRAERVQQISQADALAEGFDARRCAKVLQDAAQGIEPVEAHSAEDAKGHENDGWLCRECAGKWAGKKGYICRGCTPETDGPAFCDKCYRPLFVSLSQYGIDRELRLEDDPEGKEPQHFPCRKGDAAIAAMIADGIGDLRDRQRGRLAQIGFATLWDHINAKPRGKGKTGYPWASNPWVWVVEFKRVR